MYETINKVAFPTYSAVNANMMPVIQGDVSSLPENLRGYFPLMEMCALPKGDVVYLTVNESIVEAGKTQRRGGLHTEGYMASQELAEKCGIVEKFLMYGGVSERELHFGRYKDEEEKEADARKEEKRRQLGFGGGQKFGGGSKTMGLNPSQKWGGGWGGGSATTGFNGSHGGQHGGRRSAAGGMPYDSGLYMASTDGACDIYNFQTWDVDHHGGLKFKPEIAPERMTPNMLYWLTDRTPHEAMPAEKTGPRQFFRLVSTEVSVWYAQHNTANPLGITPPSTTKVVNFSKF